MLDDGPSALRSTAMSPATLDSPVVPDPAGAATRSEIELDTTTTTLNDAAVTTSPPTATAKDDRVEEDKLAPVDRGWHAWRFVLAGFLLDAFVWGGTFAYGTWLEYYLSHPPFDTQKPVSLAAVGTIALALNYGEMLIGIILCRKWPHHVRKGLWACLIVYVASLLIASFASELWMLILFQGVLAGSAGGLLYAPIYVYLSQWFQARRALAGGTIFAGAGLGGFAFPLILNALFPPLGFRWTLRLFSLVTFIICGISVHWIRPRFPIIRPPPKSIPSSSLSSTQLLAREEAASAARLSLYFLYDPSFLLSSTTVLVQGFMYSPILTYLPTYLASFESSFLCSLTLALMNLATIPGLMMTGHLCDRYPYTYVQFISTTISTLVIFLLLRTGDDFVKTLFFALLMGMTGGGFASTWFPASIDIASNSALRPDQAQTAPIFGYLAIGRGIASIVGPVVAGSTYNPTSLKGDKSLGKFGLDKFVVFVGTMGAASMIMSGVNEVYRRWRLKVVGKRKRRNEMEQLGKSDAEKNDGKT